MSKKQYRKDKTCLNCRHVVADKFCSNCGQENVDTRKTFHHLFIHFFEDLTHYENAFWRTIKNLLFKPSALTTEYLSGKRLSYLAPVRLYIFISFLTFFLIAIAPGKDIKKSILDSEKKNEAKEKRDSINNVKNIKIGNKLVGITYSDEENAAEDKEEKIDYHNKYYSYDSIKAVEDAKIKPTKEDIALQKILESKDISKDLKEKLKEKIDETKKEESEGFLNFGYKDIRALDSVQKFGKPEDKEDAIVYWLLKKSLKVKENNTKDEIIDKGIASAKSNFPKVLLIYMPIFALFLWVFHGKKRWFYFDHGIFTLHYFSFLLLINLLMYFLLKSINLLVENSFTSVVKSVIQFAGYGWMFYYFFPAHHRFYGESRWMSFFKSISLFWINMFLIMFLFIGFFFYTLINIK